MIMINPGQLFTEHDPDDNIVSAYIVVEPRRTMKFSDIPDDRIKFYCVKDDEQGIGVSPGEIISYTEEMFIDWEHEDCNNLTKWKLNGEYFSELYERTV